MPETNLVKCYLCGKEAPNTEMAPAGAPALGHHLDFSMAVQWFCPKPCFETYRNSPHLRARVYQWQDNCAKWAKACVRECAEENLQEMESLPEGLKITRSERQRWSQLRDMLDQVEDLQSFEDNVLLHKICRNLNESHFYNGKTRTFKDYDSLKKDFEKLETLTPEERRKLN